MNVVNKNFPMWRYICVIGVIIMMLCGITRLLSSCTEEVKIDPVSSGKMVSVHFKLDDTVYGDNEVLTHSAEELNPETVVVPLIDDLSMVATLEEDLPVNTRSANTTTLDEGVKLRIVAYENGNTYRKHVDYTVDNHKNLISSDIFEIPAGSYKFVAYSYNSSNLPPHNESQITNIDPSNDLLWGCVPNCQITETKYDVVSIMMSHQLSQVKVVATTDPLGININNINTASITPGKMVNLDVKDGALNVGGDATQIIPSWTYSGATATSDPRIVFTDKANPFQFHINTLKLQGYSDFSNVQAEFSKQLVGGTSYTLKVNFRKIILEVTPTLTFGFSARNSTYGKPVTITTNQPSWTASSNVSWLNFPTSGTGNSMTVYPNSENNNYSADRSATITVSAGGMTKTVAVTQQHLDATSGQTYSNGADRIYISGSDDNAKLLLTQNPNKEGAFFQFGGVRGWSFKTSGSAAKPDYNPTNTSVTSWNGSWTYSNSGSNNSVGHTIDNLKNGKGDPCSLVGYTQKEVKDAITANIVLDNKLWRLPNQTDFYNFYHYYGGWLTSGNPLVYGASCGDPQKFMPADGHILSGGTYNYTSGSGGAGYYWTGVQNYQNASSSLAVNNAHYFLINSSGQAFNAESQATGMNIRCMRQ